MDFLDNKVDLWLNNQITPKEMISQLENEESKLKTTEEFNFFYEKSLINFYKGRVYFYIDEEKDSIKYLESAITNAQKANSITESSDSWRIISESRSYIMLLKDVPYIIKHSKSVNDNALKALEIDKYNHRASIIVANGFINAPWIFGGDIDKGIGILKNLNLEKAPKDIKFSRLFTLAKAYKKKKKTDLAKTYCEKALEIYPKNIEAKDYLLSLKR